MPNRRQEQLSHQVDNADLVFRNFSGVKTKFNNEGKRNFCIILNEEDAKLLLDEGWAVKFLDPREEGDTPTPYLQITVNFDKGRPPRVVMKSSSAQTDLTKDTVGNLDFADIRKADLIFVEYNWEVGDKTGRAAYLKTLVVEINEDELEKRYKLNAAPVATSSD